MGIPGAVAQYPTRTQDGLPRGTAVRSVVLLLDLPGTVLDLHHHACALVESEVIGGRHVEYAVRAGDILRGLERIAQRGMELRRARLRLLQRDGNGGHQQVAGVPRVAAEG